MILSPVMHVGSRKWMLGVIRDHKAEPLDKQEIEAHIRRYKELESRIAELEAVVGLVNQCVEDQKNGYDVLASDSWDRVVERLKASEAAGGGE